MPRATSAADVLRGRLVFACFCGRTGELVSPEENARRLREGEGRSCGRGCGPVVFDEPEPAPPPELGTVLAELVVYGKPRTKKNTPVVTEQRIPLPSKAFRAYAKLALPQLTSAWSSRAEITTPVCCTALWYRDRDQGDPVGFYQGLADLLQDAGVLKDDKLVRHWDGSRLLIDRATPRVVLTLTACDW